MGRITNNIDKYQRWDKCWFKNAEIRDTFGYLIDDVLQNGVTVTFRGKELHFDCLSKEDLNVDFCFKDLGLGKFGRYIQRTNTIEFNESIRQNAAKIYETINHELRHKIQHALVKHIEQYKDQQEHYQYLKALKHEIENGRDTFQSFGLQFTGDVYISGAMYQAMGDLVDENKVPKIESVVAEAFYHMQLSERESFDCGVNAASPISSARKDGNELNKEIWRAAVAEYFNLRDISYEELCGFVDAAKENIIFGEAPKNDIEAAFTYKIAALLNAQYDPTLEKEEQEVEQYLKNCEPDVVAEKLQNSYDVSFVDIRYEKDILIEPENITEMPDMGQESDIDLNELCQEDIIPLTGETLDFADEEQEIDEEHVPGREQ